jgi:5-methylcytosine-specific restriction endonuclease McrA
VTDDDTNGPDISPGELRAALRRWRDRPATPEPVLPTTTYVPRPTAEEGGKKSRLRRWLEGEHAKDPHCRHCRRLTHLDYRYQRGHAFATLDHIIPKAKGGTDRIENRQLYCLKCNREKGDQFPWPTPKAADEFEPATED